MPYYDTVTGIKSHLISLKGLNQLIDDRREAGYDRHERLTEYYLFGGRIWLDAAGNCMVVSGELPDLIDKLAEKDVWGHDDFWDAVRKYAEGRYRPFGYTFGFVVPEAASCPVCGQKWSINDWYDCKDYHDDATLPINRFIGMTLGELRRILEERTDGQYVLNNEYNIRNDDHIDLMKIEKTTLPRNAFGWITCNDSYVIQDGDEADVTVWKFYHPDCHKEELAIKQYYAFRQMLDRAGYGHGSFWMFRVPNEYGSESYRGPWFNVRTEFGFIRIGWRSHVIEIDWEGTGNKLGLLFADVEATKDEYSVHAYNETEAVEYLRRIRETLTKGK